MAEIVQGSNSVVKYDVAFVGDKLVASIGTLDGGASNVSTLDAKLVVDALGAKIGGWGPEVAALIDKALATVA